MYFYLLLSVCIVYSISVTKKQREDIAKLSYDMIKLTYTGFIIGGIISPKGFNLLHIIFGLSLCMVFFVIGYWLAKKEG